MSNRLTVLDIITAKLRELGADGLSDGEECGCGLDDLMPCGQWGLDCMPAKAWKCADCGEGCDMRGTGEPCYKPMRLAEIKAGTVNG